MASHRPHNGGSNRFGSPAVDVMNNTSTRLPTRTTLSPTLSISSTTPVSSRLTKRRPSTRKEAVPESTHTRTSSGLRRLAGEELRRELEQPVMPVPAPTSSRRMVPSPQKSKTSQSHRVAMPEPARTPSLFSGSSASTNDSPKSTRLRRKQSNVGKQNIRTSPDSTSSRDGMGNPGQDYKDPYPDAVLGIAMPPVSSGYNAKDPQDEIIHLDQYVLAHPNFSSNHLPLPTPMYATSSTPSTGYSPGPFSISSTPTSMSSASPSVVSATGSRPKLSSPGRSRPPVSRVLADEMSGRVDTRGLPSVRESSSSSSSTLRGGESRSRERRKFSPLPPTSPTPPLQNATTSSHHRRSSSGAKVGQNATAPTARREVPPELAHLVDAPHHNRKGSIGGGMPPARPSRDGAPEIIVQEKSPIIQSNMTSLPSALHKRQSSSESRRLGGPLSIDTHRSRFGLPRARTVSPSPSQSSAMSPMTSTVPTRGFTPDIPSESEASSKVRPSPLTESKPFSRFGFFSKKNKNEAATAAAQRDKRAKKGPVAGTGHEGYGRFALRGRSGSTTSGSGNTSAGRSPSTDSAIGTTFPTTRSRKSSFGSKNGSNSSFEDFLAERERPIAIRGGKSERPALEKSRTDGSLPSQSEETPRPVQFEPPRWDNAATLEPPKRPVLLPSPMSDPLLSTTPAKRNATLKAQKEEKSSLPSLSSLTSRRTSRRSFLGGRALAQLSQDDVTSTESVAMDGASRSNSVTTEAPRKMSAQSRAEPEREKQASLKPPKKWGFLQRSKSPMRKDSVVTEQEHHALNRPTTHRSVAHYAMAGGSTMDADELEKIMQEAEGSTPEDGSASESERLLRARGKGKAPRHGNSILLPAPPKFQPPFARQQRPASPKVSLKSPPTVQSPPEPEQEPQSPPSNIAIVGQPRPSRLPQVGRIPRVVSKRDRERKLPDNSFSRPFAPSQPSPALNNGPLPENPSMSNPELVKINFNGLPDLAMASATKGLDAPSDDLARSPAFSPLGFMSFPPRKGSEQSYCSSSSGFNNLFATTAIVPDAEAPFSDDEIWAEYDDVLDMLGPYKTPKTPKTPMTGSSLGAPFQYAEFSPKDAVTALRPSTAPIDAKPELDLPQVPTVASFAQQIRIPSLHDSRIVSSLPSAGTPHSPFRMSDFVGSYGERNLSVLDPISGRLSLPSNGRLSTSTNGRFSLPATMRPQSNHTLPATRHKPTKSSSSCDSQSMERAETAYMGFENLANLRFGALMTSKWLSFGRVLFSPAHNELSGRGENRVLIIDGLGKDWSFYVALNYPNASVYNLGTDPTDESSGATSPIQSVSNHRHIHHPSLLAPFPFPKGFFAAVVLRFPVATTEAAYKSAVFECKRVLRPGGYLEISSLDMDMMNMGSKARAALRGLKTRMQAEDSSVTLKPLSDTIQRLLYRRGFENLNRCYVGVPAAGRIPGSRDEIEEPHSASVESSRSAGSGPGSNRAPEDLPFFSDLMRAQGQPSADEGMTKMVSRVGRWWYSRCFESLVLPEGDMSKSIWADEQLVRECEKRGTSLKLMICYAQKPDCPVRRTISV